MSSLINREEIKRNTDEAPDVDRLKEALSDTLSQLSIYINQTERNYNTRNNLWANQHLESGRKKGSTNNPAYPWEDASDIRPFVVDSYIRENKALLVKSLLRGNLTAVPVEGNDIERGQMISQFMKWRLQTCDGFDRQARILADYQEEKGIGVVGVFWDTKIEEVMQSVSLEDIANADPENPQVGAELIALIEAPDTAKQAADVMMRFFPSVSRSKANKMVRELRKTGTTKVGVPEVISNKPLIQAYSVDEDVFFQPNILDIQDAPYIFHRVFMTPEQLRAKIVSDEWNEEWVNDVIENTTGKQTSSLLSLTNTSYSSGGTKRLSASDVITQESGLCSVIYAYEKATTEDGVPGVFCTAMHPDVEGFGKSDLLDYKPSRYPFVAFPREYRTRRLMDSRGSPEILKGCQDEIKVQQDSRVDRTHLTTCPPREHPLGRKPLNWGPGDSLGVRRRGEYGFVEVPGGSIRESIEIEQTVRNNMNRTMGRPVQGEEPQHSIDVLQDMVDQWLRNWVQVMNQVWDLQQQFGNDIEMFRVIGSRNVEAMQMIKADGHERVDFYFDYAVINADAAVLLDKLKAFGEIASAYDRSGSFDFDEFLRAVGGAIDSSYPDRFVKPVQQVTEEEMRKTQDDLAKIASGQVVNAPPNANVQLRIQEVQKYLQGTEDIPAQDNQQRYQQDELFRARIDKYVQQLQFQEQQRQNAVTGRLGTEAGNSLPSA